MSRVADDAAKATVVDMDGQVHELQELWKDKTTVFVFLRHFG